MKTETLINIGIGTACLGLALCAVLWIVIADTPGAIQPKPKPADTVMVQDSCNYCGVIKTYSLNVNHYHYGDSIEE